MAQHSIPSEHELEKMATHVIYEVDMFRSCFSRWRSLNDKDPDWNPTLESALLHFRVLREFFLSKDPKNDDDVLAIYYVKEPNWNSKELKIFEETRDEIHKRLAHLTTRLQPPIIWKRGEMEIAMEKLITAFKVDLSNSAALWFKGLHIQTPELILSQETSSSTASVIKYNS